MNKLKNFVKDNKFLYTILTPIATVIRYLNAYLRYVIFRIKRFLVKVKVLRADPLIAGLKNRYEGQAKRVFVIATGPSLTLQDLNTLDENGEISISMNGIFRVFNNTNWRPTYYMLADPGAFEKQEFQDCKYEECAQLEVLMSTFCRKKLKYSVDRDKIGFFEYNLLDHGAARKGSTWFKYSSEYDVGIYDFYTITNCAIALADYMGVKEIYLLGVDCNYTGPKVHVGQAEREISDEEIKSAMLVQKNMIASYERINEYMKERGIKVYNATRGGALEAFSRVGFDSLFE